MKLSELFAQNHINVYMAWYTRDIRLAYDFPDSAA